MSSTSRCFRINAPQVIHEVIDGEAVLVNLDSGSYYSTDRVGAEIWSLISLGTPVQRIVDAIAHQYNGSREAIEDGVTQLLEQLQQENLIVPDGDREPGAGAAASASANIRPGKDLSFEAPVLHKYTDMEDLLLLDPIHDVDETGWPKLPPEDQ